MHIYVKYENSTAFIKNVVLCDGYIPMVGLLVDLNNKETPNTEAFDLNPALWYKTLLVDALYINCNERDCRWTPKTDGSYHNGQPTLTEGIIENVSAHFFPENGHHLNYEIEIDDFDPSNEEFMDRVIDIIVPLIKKKLSIAQFKLEIVRIVHCYVLPMLQLGIACKSKLEEVIAYIEGQYERMEMTLLNKVEKQQPTINSLQKQRSKIVSNEMMQSESYVRSCNREFLTIFLKDIEKDILNVNLEFEEISKEISTLKTSRNEQGDLINEYRESRNQMFDWLEKLQTVRETIKNAIYRSRKTKKDLYKKVKIVQNIYHTIYLEISRRLNEEKEDIQQTCLRKVKLSSVREAAYSALSELNECSKSNIAMSSTDGSEFSLKIMGLQCSPPGWSTIEEIVTNNVADPSKLGYNEHIQGCQMILDLIEASLKEGSIFGSTKYPLQKTRDSSAQSRSSCSDSDIINELNNLSVQNLKIGLENIKCSFKHHMNNMCYLFMRSIPKCNNHRSKIWVSYESCLSTKCLPRMMHLYDLTFEPTCRELYKNVAVQSLHDILNGDEIYMKFLINCLNGGEPKLTVAQDSQEELDESDLVCRPVSLASVELEVKKCALNDLYAMANKDCCALETFIANTEECRISPHGSMISLVIPVESSSEDSDDTDSMVSLDDIEQRAEITKFFSVAIEMLGIFLRSRTILDKLRKLTKLFKFIGSLFSDLHDHDSIASCDDMLSMLIVFFWCLDEATFLPTYSHVRLLVDLMPDFLCGHIHDNTITNFFIAFSFLFDGQVMMREKRTRFR